MATERPGRRHKELWNSDRCAERYHIITLHAKKTFCDEMMWFVSFFNSRFNLR